MLMALYELMGLKKINYNALIKLTMKIIQTAKG